MSMNDAHSESLFAAMALLETAFSSGNDDWKKLPEFSGMDERDLAGMAFGLIQFVALGQDSPQLQAARKAMAVRGAAAHMDEEAGNAIH